MTYLTDSSARQQICQGLMSFFSDTMVLYMKTHGFHWNIEGPQFHTLHLLFEDQYTDLWKSLDVIAERIRALGFKAPQSLGEVIKVTEMKEATGTLSCQQMLADLRGCNIQLSQKASKCAALAETFEDRVTVDLITERSERLEMNAWMLNSSIEQTESVN